MACHAVKAWPSLREIRRELPLGAQSAEESELDFVDERTARERVEHIERFDLFARPQLVDRLQEEAVWTDREALQCGR